ncbi:MAG: YesL family protein [Lachnospiraceae bacterium]
MRFLGYEGLFARTMSRVFDFVVLHLLWLICSLPLVTIGASTTALYTVTLKMAKGQEGYIVKNYFKAFKENFVQATKLWAVMIGMGVWLLFLIRVCMYGGGAALKMIALFLVSLLFLWAITIVYLFPIQAKYENSTWNTLKNAFICAVKYLPYSICMLGVIVVPVVLTGFVASIFPVMITFWMFCGSSVISYINAILFNKVMSK